jgi:lysyl-tRNA synthetase, class II
VSEEPSSRADVFASRRRKLQELRAAGVDPFPHEFSGVEPIAAVRAQHAPLQPGEETSAEHRVAGRITARRGQGRMAFLDLLDRSGRIQLQARVDELGQEGMDRLLELDLGDIVGVDGLAFSSRRGELTLRILSYRLLAKSLRPPPEKHHGLRDVETRFRHREADLVANQEVRELFMLRARVVSAIRRYLDGEGFVEVETPVLQPVYGGALARPFTTHHNELDRDLYLRIATELYLKRLIVGGLERVYELGKDFRNEGVSHKHNPEFTMVEWYEAYADYEDEAARLEALVRTAAAAADYGGEVDFGAPWRRVTFAQAIEEATGIDVMANSDAASLAAAIERAGVGVPSEGLPWFALADDLLSKCVEPKLVQPTFVLDYPLELSPFAREHRSDPRLVERWEAFAGGMEIANAFSELNDPVVQRERFEAQQRLRAQGAEETQPHDELFIEALEQGMPPTGGVGLGIDRLVMVLTGQSSIREVVLFPAMRQ